MMGVPMQVHPAGQGQENTQLFAGQPHDAQNPMAQSALLVHGIGHRPASNVLTGPASVDGAPPLHEPLLPAPPP
jgi:hypothetical protein